VRAGDVAGDALLIPRDHRDLARELADVCVPRLSRRLGLPAGSISCRATGVPVLLVGVPRGKLCAVADTKMTKSAGEHWVCSVLARHGWGAALTRDGLERTDILAVQSDGERRMVEIQVKAAREIGSRTNWPINDKAQQLACSDREWFAFIVLPTDIRAAPRTFVVPRNHVSAGTWIFHHAWKTDPSVSPGKRNAPVSQARIYVEAWQGYEDRWDLLDKSAYEAPVLLPDRSRRLALEDRVGLPPGHPWTGHLPSGPWPGDSAT
jgi:hypothetical protein